MFFLPSRADEEAGLNRLYARVICVGPNPKSYKDCSNTMAFRMDGADNMVMLGVLVAGVSALAGAVVTLYVVRWLRSLTLSYHV